MNPASRQLKPIERRNATATAREPGEQRPPEIADLYRRYGPMLQRRVRQFFAPHEVEEVLHEVFVRVIETIDTFRGESSIAHWLYRVATNHCLNRLRTIRRRRELLRDHEASLWYPSAQAPSQEHALFLSELWKELPAELADIGVYHYVDGLCHDEIAALLGVSRRTIGNRLDELRRRAERRVGRAGKRRKVRS